MKKIFLIMAVLTGNFCTVLPVKNDNRSLTKRIPYLTHTILKGYVAGLSFQLGNYLGTRLILSGARQWGKNTTMSSNKLNQYSATTFSIVYASSLVEDYEKLYNFFTKNKKISLLKQIYYGTICLFIISIPPTLGMLTGHQFESFIMGNYVSS
jgi:hypothetical protein